MEQDDSGTFVINSPEVTVKRKTFLSEGRTLSKEVVRDDPEEIFEMNSILGQG
jgi:hypothetical protein